MSATIMVVDDDEGARGVLEERLSHEGYEVVAVESAEAALSRIADVEPELVITDLRMPGLNGLELLEKIREATEGVDVVVVTGHEDMSTAVAAMKAGAFDYLVKPLKLSEVADLVARCLREQELNRQVAEARASDEGAGGPEDPGRHPLGGEGPGAVVGRDPRMIEIYKVIGVLARNRATVLVRGETGTGKEVIARAIHANSAHQDEPFIAVNCTALTDTLLESELFGHVKGAFTGAVSGRKGYFELAGSGTVFLDEIGDTSPEFQSKLLRVLQERCFYPVGGEDVRTTDARVIAATHQPVEELVEEGRFREDLYFRLRVVEIRVPSLRERPGDIPLLVAKLLERIREETRQPVRHVSEEAMEMLVDHPWPGNVRELENALTRAAILARGAALGVQHLSLGGDRFAGAYAKDAPAGSRSLDAVVAAHVRRVLADVGGDAEEAARLLEIEREELDRYVEQYELDTPDSDG